MFPLSKIYCCQDNIFLMHLSMVHNQKFELNTDSHKIAPPMGRTTFPVLLRVQSASSCIYE